MTRAMEDNVRERSGMGAVDMGTLEEERKESEANVRAEVKRQHMAYRNPQLVVSFLTHISQPYN
jgi:hypothetical protein